MRIDDSGNTHILVDIEITRLRACFASQLESDDILGKDEILSYDSQWEIARI